MTKGVRDEIQAQQRLSELAAARENGEGGEEEEAVPGAAIVADPSEAPRVETPEGVRADTEGGSEEGGEGTKKKKRKKGGPPRQKGPKVGF